MNIEEYIGSMDPELRTGFIQMKPFFSSVPSDPVAARKWMAEMLAATFRQGPKNDRVRVENRSIPGPTGAPDVPIRIYTPTARTGTLPGLLYIHGGGFTQRKKAFVCLFAKSTCKKLSYQVYFQM